MRGKALRAYPVPGSPRITPAHAGKRRLLSNVRRVLEDHPRACGEKLPVVTDTHCDPGSPPRMRGKGCKRHLPRRGHGITPAHAGKSLLSCSLSLIHWDHPRACGEKSKAACAVVIGLGSPPRMRGEAAAGAGTGKNPGITPAHAGRSLAYQIRVKMKGDHPRACGEKIATWMRFSPS